MLGYSMIRTLINSLIGTFAGVGITFFPLGLIVMMILEDLNILLPGAIVLVSIIFTSLWLYFTYRKETK